MLNVMKVVSLNRFLFPFPGHYWRSLGQSQCVASSAHALPDFVFRRHLTPPTGRQWQRGDWGNHLYGKFQVGVAGGNPTPALSPHLRSVGAKNTAVTLRLRVCCSKLFFCAYWEGSSRTHAQISFQPSRSKSQEKPQHHGESVEQSPLIGETDLIVRRL